MLLAHGDMTRFRLLSLCHASMSAGVVNRPAEKHLTFLSFFPREVDGVLHCYYVTLIFRLHSLWFSSALICDFRLHWLSSKCPTKHDDSLSQRR